MLNRDRKGKGRGEKQMESDGARRGMRAALLLPPRTGRCRDRALVPRPLGAGPAHPFRRRCKLPEGLGNGGEGAWECKAGQRQNLRASLPAEACNLWTQELHANWRRMDLASGNKENRPRRHC